MTKLKQADKIVDLLMKDTFKTTGEIDQLQVRKHIKSLKVLPMPNSIITLSEYLRRIKSELAKTTLEIETPTPLTGIQIKQIVNAIKADHQVSDIRSTINPSLFGGLRIKIGDVVYDDSVSRKILQLGEAITS